MVAIRGKIGKEEENVDVVDQHTARAPLSTRNRALPFSKGTTISDKITRTQLHHQSGRDEIYRIECFRRSGLTTQTRGNQKPTIKGLCRMQTP